MQKPNPDQASSSNQQLPDSAAPTNQPPTGPSFQELLNLSDPAYQELFRQTFIEQATQSLLDPDSFANSGPIDPIALACRRLIGAAPPDNTGPLDPTAFAGQGLAAPLANPGLIDPAAFVGQGLVGPAPLPNTGLIDRTALAQATLTYTALVNQQLLGGPLIANNPILAQPTPEEAAPVHEESPPIDVEIVTPELATQILPPLPELPIIENQPGMSNFSDFVVVKQLSANGAPSTVFEALHSASNTNVVLKMSPENAKAEYEALLHGRISHPQIVPFIATFVDLPSNQRAIVTAKCKTDLLAYGTEEVIAPDMIQKFALQMCKGIKYLHDNGILHRDIKPDNMFITEADDLVIGDFGHATAVTPDGVYEPRQTTVNYRPLEIVLGENRYGFPLDIWCAGATWCFFYRRCHLSIADTDIGQIDQIFQVFGSPDNKDWPELDALCEKANVKLYENIPFQFSRCIPGANTEAQMLIYRMMKYNPAKRLTIDEVLADDYFKTPDEAVTRGASSRPPFPHPVGGPEETYSNKNDPAALRAELISRGYHLVSGLSKYIKK